MTQASTIGIMFLANYFSWCIGETLLMPVIAKTQVHLLGDQPLYNTVKFMIAITIRAYLLTLLLELPFCYWACRNKNKRLLKTVTS